MFPNLNDSVTALKNVVDVLRSSADKKSDFFHIFYKKKSTTKNSKKMIVNSIAKSLIKAIDT